MRLEPMLHNVVGPFCSIRAGPRIFLLHRRYGRTCRQAGNRLVKLLSDAAGYSIVNSIRPSAR
jgi:hypothetical protein